MLPFDFLSPFIELLAALLGFFYVYLIATEKASGWFFGIASAFFYAIFFWRSETWGLFSQQIAYILLGFYGLFTWSDKKEELPIRSLGQKIWIWICCGLLGGIIFLSLTSFFSSERAGSQELPTFTEFIDAQFFVFSLIATWLTTRKILENWLIWIVVNSVGIIWFLAEQWWSTAVLYLAYLVLAINGLRKWKKAISV
ncbi:MAG: nicotinamide riboside transporter PnuC [Flavobacteriales bacterium]